MSGCDVVVIGASAGGVEALTRLVSRLPARLDAAVFIVLHIPPASRSQLPDILDRAGPLPALHAIDGARIQHGRIYVAPSDVHLTLEPGRINVRSGPRENRHRPAIDPLFRSAAISYGSRVVGIVLSGTLDDGTAGLLEIKRHGGIAIVQHPDEALFSGMIDSALATLEVDYSLPVVQIAEVVARLAHERSTERSISVSVPNEDRISGDQMAEIRGDSLPRPDSESSPSPFACPDCGGVLWDLSEGHLLRFRCRVGHAYTVESLLVAQTEQFEGALWTALRALEEKASLARRLERRAVQQAHDRAASQFDEQASSATQAATIIREVLIRNNGARPVDDQDRAADDAAEER